MGEKKRGKIRKLFTFAIFAAGIAAVLNFVKRRRGAGLEENEWQELPPPEG